MLPSSAELDKAALHLLYFLHNSRLKPGLCGPNKYMDEYLADKSNLSAKAKAESISLSAALLFA